MYKNLFQKIVSCIVLLITIDKDKNLLRFCESIVINEIVFLILKTFIGSHVRNTK